MKLAGPAVCRSWARPRPSPQGCYLEPPAQAVGVLVDGRHLAVAPLAQLRHRAHEALDLQLSATGDAPVWGGRQTLPPAVTSQFQRKGVPLPSRGAECCPPLMEPRLARPGCARPSLTLPSPRRSQIKSYYRQSLLWGPRTGSSLPCSPFRPLPSSLGTASVYPGVVSSLPTEAAFFPSRSRVPPWDGPAAVIFTRGSGLGAEPRGLICPWGFAPG